MHWRINPRRTIFSIWTGSFKGLLTCDSSRPIDSSLCKNQRPRHNPLIWYRASHTTHHMTQSNLSIMTFNVGLAGWNVFGIQIDIVPETESRYEKIRDFIIAESATHDVICLQEVFGAYRDQLLVDIASHYPHTYTHSNHLTGLCIVSKHTINEPRDGEYPLWNQLGTDIMFPKGYMGVMIGGNLVVNAQTSIGGGISSTNIYVELVRAKQIGELIAFVNWFDIFTPTHMRILCGDFNCAPEQSYKNYLQLCEHGYDVGRVDPLVTWDKNNPMINDSIVSKVFFSNDISQRCDLIFVRGDHYDEPFTPNITQYTTYCSELSDHYAVSCVISHPY